MYIYRKVKYAFVLRSVQEEAKGFNHTRDEHVQNKETRFYFFSIKLFFLKFVIYFLFQV